MTRDNYFSRLWGKWYGGVKETTEKVQEELYSNVAKYGGSTLDATSSATLPSTPMPWGLYVVATGGAVNGAALTLATGDLVIYDPINSKWRLIAAPTDLT